MARSRRRLVWLVAATVSVAAPACTSGGDGATGDRPDGPADATSSTEGSRPGGDSGPDSSSDAPTTSDSTTPPASTPPNIPEPSDPSPVDPACRPGPGRTVKELPDVAIAAIHVPAFDSPHERIGNTVVPGARIPAVDLPAQLAEGGCVVTYDAPGGCLAAVRITGAAIPGRAVPGASLPPVVVGGETLFDGDRSLSATSEGDATDALLAQQVCQVPTSGERRSAVSRPALSRPALLRPALSRPSLTRPALCIDVADGAECTEGVYVKAVYAKKERVPSAYVRSASLRAEPLDGAPDTTVLAGAAEQAYVTQAEALFDVGEADLKPGAVPTLQAIATHIGDLPAGARVRIEAHTDEEGPDAVDEQLSMTQADAVATWFRTEGGVTVELVTTKGYGGSVPAAPNDTDEHRAQNRRLVITVTTP